VLLADRPQGKPYAGYWEFPGGKIEPGESVAAALARELHEELGVDIGAAAPWVSFEFDYPHAYVRLHFCRVTHWTGTPRGREGQRLDFFPVAGDLPAPLLPAAVPALKWLLLPATYAISNAGELGLAEFLRRLEHALERGIRLIQLREPTFSDDAMAELLHAVLPRARAVGARVMVSSRHPRALWSVADGVHLTARDLLRLESRADLPKACGWVGASVHDRAELEHAARVGCDFVVVGPVLPTASHPGAKPLGWTGLADLIRKAALPVYAIGGMCPLDLGAAQQAGAHGIAMMRAAWPQP
jgi:8-oxo-dGTP diphosphatase